MKKCLINVDSQIDFISGSLPVPGAVETTNRMVQRLYDETDLRNEYKDVYLTLDWHPENHISFKTWVLHCVQHTLGAAIYPSLAEILYTIKTKVHKLTKGSFENKEEYSVFNNYFSGNVLSRALELEQYEEIHIAGVAGDFCVAETIKSLIELGYQDKIVVLTDCIASIDGGKTIDALIMKYNLKTK